MTHGRQQLKGRNRTNKLVFFPQPGEILAEDGQLHFDKAHDIRIGEMVKVSIERATAWSLQGCAVEV
jgi:tRNA-2-methylthio-N6-dimethylallyladenosine synthase